MRCDLELPAVDPAEYLVVRLNDISGRPVDGVLQFDFEHRFANGGGRSSPVQPLRAPDGSYFLGIPAPSRPAYFACTRATVR